MKSVNAAKTLLFCGRVYFYKPCHALTQAT